MEYQDKTLVCRDCGQEFIFAAGEQAFFEERGFEREPIRCKPCRDKRKNSAGGRERPMFDAVCSECGKECKVPFNPVNGRPVYCGDCFSRVR